ncbi:MAG: dihydrolipoyl dehydrogenase [Prevotella sp.]
MTKTSDIIIIGSGPGGYRAAHHAATNGLTVTIFESGEPGGTCLNCGCIPTKTLCRNAELLDTLTEADTFGLDNMNYTFDFGKVKARKDEVVAQLRGGIETLMKTPDITFVREKAAFKDNRTIVAGGNEYTADNIIIATGSVSAMPPIEGIKLEGVVSSTEMLDTTTRPERLCIIGAGVIGMEFASIYNSFGSEVTVIEFLKEALPTLDSDIAKRLRQTIARRGVNFYMQSAVSRISEHVDEESGKRLLKVTFDKKGKTSETFADMVLVATGRRANTAELALENTDISFDKKGIHTDEHFATNVEHVYAIGDVNGKCMLAHAATFQGLHVVNRILGRQDDIRHEIMPSAIFTNPEAASVGLSEDQCKTLGLEYSCRKGFYRANGKALAMNETDGMIKLITDNENHIIGCHVFGAHASDMVQEITVLMNSQATTQQLRDIIHIHPTLAEILHDMAMS